MHISVGVMPPYYFSESEISFSSLNSIIPFGRSPSWGSQLSMDSPFVKCFESIWLHLSSQASDPRLSSSMTVLQKPHQNRLCPICCSVHCLEIYSLSRIWCIICKWAWNCSRRRKVRAHWPIWLVEEYSLQRHSSIS